MVSDEGDFSIGHAIQWESFVGQNFHKSRYLANFISRTLMFPHDCSISALGLLHHFCGRRSSSSYGLSAKMTNEELQLMLSSPKSEAIIMVIRRFGIFPLRTNNSRGFCNAKSFMDANPMVKFVTL